MLLLFIFIFFSVSIILSAYHLSRQKLVGELRLPAEIKSKPRGKISKIADILTFLGRFTDHLIKKVNVSFLGKLKKKLSYAGKPINISQFFALKFLTMAIITSLTLIIVKVQGGVLIIFLCVGFFLPDLWLNNLIKKRARAVLKDLPHVIDLLSICVEAGLDFMIAVNRVVEEFHPCVLVNEIKVLVKEINMGSSRREALKGLSGRIDSPEMASFVRTLLQAERMGTPIGEVLGMQAEEIRIRRFQKGEEMALKAPVKLLFPLLFFILPVVLIIVAGPILIQFTRGGLLKF